MKNTCIIILALFTSFNLSFSQKKKADDYESYVKMYHNRSIDMVRSHSEFIAYLKDHPKLKTAFDKKTITRFLMDLKFCADGLVTLRIPEGIKSKDPDGFLLEVSGIMGMSPTMAKDTKNAYCKMPLGGCAPDQVSICITDNCGKSISTGKDFDYRILSPDDF